ncbi:MAG: electron transporter RnfD, partial [Gammaproteobacteria bacterium]
MPENVTSIEIQTSPHLRKAPSVESIMGNVALALLPVCGFGIFVFGWSALAVLLVSAG